ncbi:MAG: DUF397 domain-containing protein [Actinomycetota bacterium]
MHVSVNGNGIKWRKSSFSGPVHCVEVAHVGHVTVVRDSKQRGCLAPAVLSVSGDAWRLATLQVCSDRSHGVNGELAIKRLSDGSQTWRSVRTGVELHFTAAEIDAFRLGVLDGQFDRPQLAA